MKGVSIESIAPAILNGTSGNLLNLHVLLDVNFTLPLCWLLP